MKLTPQQRRNRIYMLAEENEEYRQIIKEYDEAKQQFTRLTQWLPGRLRNILWSYPGMGYFMHHRLLTMICEKMCFPDENT